MRLGFKITGHPPLTLHTGMVVKKSKTKYMKHTSYEKEMRGAIARRIKENFGLVSFNFTPFSTNL